MLPIITLALMLQQPAAEPVSETKALWDKMVQAYAGAQTMYLEAILTGREQGAEEDDPRITVKTFLKWKRPNLFRLQQIDQPAGSAHTVVIVSDGKRIYVPMGDKTIGREAPPQMAGALRYFDQSLADAGLHLVLTLGSEFEVARFYKNLRNLKLGDRVVLDGRPMDVMSGDYKNSKGDVGQIQFTISADDHMLRKLVVRIEAPIVNMDETGQVQQRVAILYTWNFTYDKKPNFESGTFAAPPGAIVP